MRPAVPLADRFAMRVGPEAPNGCRLWTGAVASTGYGVITAPPPTPGVYGKQMGAHVVSWQLANGKDVPEGLVVRHTCDVRTCVAAAHLAVGKQADNIRDMTSRGRQARGERVANARLRADDVRQIREKAIAGEPQRAIAQTFGISQPHVSRIARREGWQHV